jgi:iron complex outermembrane receptor protein
MISTGSRLATFLGTASFVTLATALDAHAQQVAQGQVAQARDEEVPEQVLVTGSLIRGTAAVGVPVTNLSPQDFAMTGAITTSELFRTIPQFNVNPGPVSTQGNNRQRGVRVNLRNLDTQNAVRSLMLVDGMRYPTQSEELSVIDPSIIPSSAIERVDLLLDGASATYGSDAIGGVINIILKRNYDGAMVEAGFKAGRGGNVQYLASGTWGRTWDGGQVTLSYQWIDAAPAHGNNFSKLTLDYTPWGLDNRTPIGSSAPGTVSTGNQIGLSMPDPKNPGASIPNPNYPGNTGTNCQNCYAIPRGTGFDWQPGPTRIGPTLPGSAPTLNWANLSVPSNGGTNGTRNLFNPFTIVDYSAATQYTGAAITVDQRLTKNISFYGSGLYGMRRSQIIINDQSNQLVWAVPTWNPYYPTGAPNNLRVGYHMGIEKPTIGSAYELGQRYQFGLNIALPSDWQTQVYFSHTKDKNYNTEDPRRQSLNKAAVSAALGWTIPVTPAQGTTPAIASWTKPATMPYLNLFCDPLAYKCNSDATLDYIFRLDEVQEYFNVRETGTKADGPLFDLPGGTVKMAVGANYTSYSLLLQQTSGSSVNPLVSTVQDPRHRQVWAAFTQVNIPVFSDKNSLPALRRLDLEFSWRHDQYNDVGGTSNAKVGFNWSPVDDFTIRGGWGQSFRAPNYGEFSTVSNVAWQGWNFGQLYSANTVPVSIVCAGGAPPVAGSAGARLYGAGFGCGSSPQGISFNGGGKVPVDIGLRNYTNIEQQVLDPEKAVNWAIGFDYSPAGNFLNGLNLQATYYRVKITGVLDLFSTVTDSTFNDPNVGFSFVTPQDLRDPATGAQLCAGQNSTPWLCAPFQDIVRKALAHPVNAVPGTLQTSVYWINDGGTMNAGWQRNEGIDFEASYDWDWAGLGAFNAGITGTYYLKQESQSTPNGDIIDFYHIDYSPANGVDQLGVESRPRLKYRTRLGWSDETWSLTGFMNYESHWFQNQSPPPNVNFACIGPGGSISGRPTYTNPCAISNYTNIIPSYYTFDLSLGYSTGDRPANEHLHNINVQLVAENIMDRTSPFAYKVTQGGGFQCGCDVSKALYGRLISVRLQKTF